MGSRRPTYLSEPGCHRGCDPCVRACAVFRIQLSWWEREEASLLRARFCAGPEDRRQWLADLSEAQERQRQLRQDIELAAPVRARAYSARLRGSSAAALAH
jgi:hypothetical protein